MAKVSVIVPCYNVSGYVRACVESLIHQTIGLENLEIILVDDASTDDGATLSVLMEYEQNYPDQIIVIPLQENMHQGGARNVGLEYATGEFIAFCDADDWFRDVACERLYQTAVKYDCDIVEFEHQSVKTYDVEDIPLRTSEASDNLWCIDSVEEQKKYIMSQEVGLGCWSRLYRASLLKDNAIRFAEHVFWEEPSVTQLVRFYVKRHYCLHEVLYYYYLRPGSVMVSPYRDKKFHNMVTYETLLEEFKKRGFVEQYPQETEFLYWDGFYFGTLIYAAYAGTFFTREEFAVIQERVREVTPDIKKNPYYQNKYYFRPQIADAAFYDTAQIDMEELYKEYRELAKLLYR